MVGADEEMSVTVVRMKFNEERVKKEEADAEPEGDSQTPEGTSEWGPQGKEGIDAEIKRDMFELTKEIKFGESQGKPDVKKDPPDFMKLMLERAIDTILLEEMADVGSKMNRYRSVLSQGILAFAEQHQEDKVDLSRLIESFRQGWKVYRVNEQEKTTLDTFMLAMNNKLWVPEDSGCQMST